ncbi:MAG: hypothetical protein WCO19_00710 [Candidatus Saccharibacteria bacterium]
MRKSLVVLLLIVSICIPAHAYAETKLKGLQVSPLRSRPALRPGDTSTGQLSLSNNTDSASLVTLSVERFRVTDEDYHYDFAPGEHTDWVRLADTKIQLNKNENKKVAYSLAIPSDAPPGGYYFAVFASTESSGSGSSFKEVKRVASLIYLEVGGVLSKKVNLLGTDAPWFTKSRQLRIDSRLANQGNTHVEARLKQSIRPLIGPVPESVQKEGLILPGSIRKLRSTVKIPWWPGIYKLSVEYSPPQGGKAESYRQILIYFPVWAWIVIGLFIVILLRTIFSKRRLSRSARKL